MPTVIVACKLPTGLHLDLAGPPPRRVTLRGTATPFGEPPIIVQGGYSLTHDVDEEFMDEWMRVYASTELVQKSIIFVHSKVADARAHSRELAEVRTGLEPLDPDKPGKGLEPVSTGSRFQ